MRRADREITDAQEMMAVLRADCVCRIAMHAAPYPYIVPMNYGVCQEDGRTMLYLHCAKEGEKLCRMRENPHVAFEVDTEHMLVTGEAACAYGFAYASIIGQGILSAVEGEEKRAGLLALMRQVAPEKTFAIDDAALQGVTVLRLDVQHMTGKRRHKPS